MVMQYCAHSNIVLFSKAFVNYYRSSFSSPPALASLRLLQDLRVAVKCNSLRSYSVMSSDTSTVNSTSSANKDSDRRSYQVVVAATNEMGIGRDGKLPWNLPSELKFFKKLTTTTKEPGNKNAVIMGRKTWEGIPLKYRPLPGRLNIVLTRSGSSGIASTQDVILCGSISVALELLAESPYCFSVENVFVIGGAQILRDTLNARECDAIHITEIENNIECDTFMPSIDFSMFQPWYSSQPVVENNIRYSFVTYVRVRNSTTENCGSSDGASSICKSMSNKFEKDRFTFLPSMIFERHEEFMYLRLVRDVISSGTPKQDRHGAVILSQFGFQMQFNLRKSFPLLTTKKVFWQEVVGELLWSITGSTNAEVLREKGIEMWDAKASRYHLHSPVESQEGELGPVHGFQWRHFGARYTTTHDDYTGQGFDQLSDVIDKIKNRPDDSGIILSSWNPPDLKLMALPPCHIFAQFYVANGELSCQTYQCSADVSFGVPFIIASYALLTCMIAHVCDLVPGDLILLIGDAHLHKTQIGPLQEQLQKLPKPFPILKINAERKDIDSFVASDLEIIGYYPQE